MSLDSILSRMKQIGNNFSRKAAPKLQNIKAYFREKKWEMNSKGSSSCMKELKKVQWLNIRANLDKYWHIKQWYLLGFKIYTKFKYQETIACEQDEQKAEIKC